MSEKYVMLKQRISRLKSQKGFTLVELMAVLVILGLILAIAIPMVGSMVDKTSKKADTASIALIEKSAEYAYLDGLSLDGERGEVIPYSSIGYTVKLLVESGYVDIHLNDDDSFSLNGETYDAGRASAIRNADTGKFTFTPDGV